jgi:hypothetical protein
MSAQVRLRVSILVIAAALGCSDHDPDRPPISIQDSVGVQIVRSNDVDWSAESAWLVRHPPLLDLGGVGASINEQFQGVSHGLLLPGGRIVIADQGDNTLKYFDIRGRFLAQAGGNGDGPGEFAHLSSLVALRHDTVAVFDSRLRRLSYYSESGRFLGSQPIAVSVPMPTLIGFLSDGGPIISSRSIAEGANSDHVGILLLRAHAGAAARIDTLGSFQGARVKKTVSREGTREISSTAPLLFSSATHVAVSGNSVLVAEGSTFEVRVYSSQGDLVRVIRMGWEPTVVSQSDVRDYIDSVVSSVQDRDQREATRGYLSSLGVATTYPAFSVLRVDPAGSIWLADYSRGGSSRKWLVFHSEGTYLGAVQVPPGVRVLDIGDSLILGLSRDELDIEHIVVYALDKSE